MSGGRRHECRGAAGFYPEEDEELESAGDHKRSCRGRESDEDTEDASETALAKHDEEDYVEMKEQMYQDKLASLKRQLQTTAGRYITGISEENKKVGSAVQREDPKCRTVPPAGN
jgi:hypothetical protein